MLINTQSSCRFISFDNAGDLLVELAANLTKDNVQLELYRPEERLSQVWVISASQIQTTGYHDPLQPATEPSVELELCV